MRVTEHPIINEFPKGRLVTFEYDGKPMEGYEGEPIAMALKSNGVEIHRYTTKRISPAACTAPSAMHRLRHGCGRSSQCPYLHDCAEGRNESSDSVRRLHKKGGR